MTNRQLFPSSLAAAVLAVAMLAGPAAAADPIPAKISIAKTFDDKGNVIFEGRVFAKRGGTAKERAACVRGRQIVLYRTVDSGFGKNTKKVATDVTGTSGGSAGEWRIKTRRSGTYVAKVAASENCAAAESRKIEYTRNLEPAG